MLASGDHEMMEPLLRMYRDALGGGRAVAGSSKRDLAQAAAASGARLVLVDDGFSHWPLARDVDVVMRDATDLWGGGALLPAGRMRAPRRGSARAAGPPRVRAAAFFCEITQSRL
jgi:tetraacyldisaccharide-1-P 4'-kinase